MLLSPLLVMSERLELEWGRGSILARLAHSSLRLSDSLCRPHDLGGLRYPALTYVPTVALAPLPHSVRPGDSPPLNNGVVSQIQSRQRSCSPHGGVVQALLAATRGARVKREPRWLPYQALGTRSPSPEVARLT